METPVKFTGDRKVTNHATSRGALGDDATVNDKNSFGLSAKRCTNRTPFCDSCYAEALERFPTIHNALEHNWQVIKPHLNDGFNLYEILMPGVVESIRQKKKRGVPESKWQFRWFWDGDIPSQQFACAMNRIAYAFPKVKFWVYTRCFQYVPQLLGPENLAVYMSTDMWNYRWAKRVKYDNPDVQYAFNGRDWEETLKLAELCGEPRGLKCPELVGRIDLVEWSTETTKAGKHIGDGACAKCDYCTVGKGNVRFAIDPR